MGIGNDILKMMEQNLSQLQMEALSKYLNEYDGSPQGFEEDV